MKTRCCLQVAAALCELAIPSLATKSIFAAAEGASTAAFGQYLQILGVSHTGSLAWFELFFHPQRHPPACNHVTRLVATQ